MSQTTYSGTLNKTQLENLWDQAGGAPGEANTASAIALAESSGKVDAKSSVADEGSYAEGLWQEEMPMHAAQVPGGNAYNPLANAKAAVAISDDGTNWTPWETYLNGAYKKYLGPGGNSASTQTSSTTSTNETTQTPSTNPLLPKGRGTGNALKYLTYALLFTTGAALLYLGITRTAHSGTSP
jgi:hypothetical protein